MALSTIAVTGGNGKIGSALLGHLSDHGYETVNVDHDERREGVADTYFSADLLGAGETYGALAKADADAVIHMGTISGPYNHPEHRTYESNVMSSMHVLEASQSLGLESCCLASSINAIGAEHQQREPQIEYVPIDERHPPTPDDEYGIAKHAVEMTADGFGRRPSNDVTLSTLRYPWVATERELIERFAGPERSMDALRDDDIRSQMDGLFSYLHVDDACSVARTAVEADYTGHETFWATAGDTITTVPTEDLVAEFFPKAEVREVLSGYETLFDLSKAEELLNWEPERSWRDA